VPKPLMLKRIDNTEKIKKADTFVRFFNFYSPGTVTFSRKSLAASYLSFLSAS